MTGKATAPAIRPAADGDRAAWEGLWRANCAHYGSAMDEATVEGLWRRIVDPAHPMHVLIAEMDGAPAGLAQYILHPHTFTLKLVCYLEDLWVEPAWRGAGVGRALIRELESMGRSAGWRRVYWVTEADNAPARALYDRVARRTGHVQYRIDLDR